MTRDEILKEPAGARLDAWVAKRGMEWETIDTGTPYTRVKAFGVIVQKDDGDLRCQRFARIGDAVPMWDWKPSTQIQWAWDVAEKMQQTGWLFTLASNWNGFYYCSFVGDEKRGGVSVSESAPEAICKAALLAKLSESP